MIRTWWRLLVRPKAPAFRCPWQHRPRPRRRSSRPEVVVLEERCVPTVLLGTNFPGLEFPTSGVGFVPPDAQLAAGPNHVIEVVNSQIAIYLKSTGTRLFTQPLTAFFNTETPIPVTPVVIYDELANRFVVGAVQSDPATQTSIFNLAVSNASDPTSGGGFTEKQRINVRQTTSSAQVALADSPRLGWNADAYVVTFNMAVFSGNVGTYAHTQVFTIAKSSVLDANPSTLNGLQSIRPNQFSLAATAMHGSAAGDPLWFVRTATGSGDSVQLTRMTNVLTAPTFTDFTVPVPSFALPPNAPQLGSSALLFTSDARLRSVALRGNRLVAAHNVGTGGVAHARWYEFSLGPTPALVQSGEINPGTGIHTYFPAVEIAANDDVAMTYLQSSSTEFLSMYITGRITADPLGTMETPVLVKGGEHAYSDFAGSPYRVGTVSGISVDPTSGTTFWAVNEFATTTATNNWGTWIATSSLTHPPGSISGQKFNDLNGNGTKDTSEPGLQGWTIFLDNNNNGTPDIGEPNTSTDFSGNYTFADLAAGTYRVREVLQTGWVRTTANPPDIVIGGNNVTGVNFGNFREIALSGQVFDDLNNNGSRDLGEPGLQGWTIFLDRNTNDSLDAGEPNVLTDANGDYSFPNLGPGTYRVRQVLPTGWTRTTNLPQDLVASSGSNVTSVHFGNVRGNVLATTSTTVVSSVNPSVAGQAVTFTATVAGIPGADTPTGTVTFRDGTTTLATGTLANGTATVTTSALSVGSHAITVVYGGGPNFLTSTSANLTQTVSQAATSGVVASSVNPSAFGQAVTFTATMRAVAPGAGTPTGTVTFRDGSTTLGTGTLTANGIATFTTTTLTVGSHALSVVYGGDPNFTTSTSATVTQTVNQVSSTISGQAFNDVNGNGTRDTGEGGLAGWTIFLETNNNGTLDPGEISVTTNATGNYTFANLGTGTFRIRAATQAGWIQTTANPADVILSSITNVPNINFGNFQLLSLSGQVFNDLNGNGSKETSEPGLPGWTLFLDGNTNGQLDTGELTTTSDATGNYSFGRVGPGTYRLREVLQASWRQTTTNPADVVASSGSNVPGLNFGNAQVGGGSLTEGEPNNTTSQANVVTVPGGNIVTAQANDWLTITGSVGNSSDVDYFQFTLADRSGVFFDIDSRETGLSSTLNSLVTVFDASGSTIVSSNDNGYDFETGYPAPAFQAGTGAAVDSSLYLDLNRGTYYVLVSSAAGTTGNYVLRLLADSNYTSTVPVFQSNPTASDTLLLDFDGHTATDIWGTYTIAPYDLNGNGAEFTPAERLAIKNVWRIVAEDYSPFAINITTSYTGSFNNGEAFRQVIGNSTGTEVGPFVGVLGVAFPFSYASGSNDNVAFTFASSFSAYLSTEIGNTISGRIMATAVEMGSNASHEFGHALGLQHYGGSNAQPDGIMQTPDSGLNREIWRRGNTHSGESPVVVQDDMAVIASSTNTFGYRPDDHGDTQAAATVLTASGGVYTAAGIIGDLTRPDLDLFRFTAGGLTTLEVNVDDYSNDLDVELRLYDTTGALVASHDPGNSFDAFLSLTLTPGTYYLDVRSDGEPGEAGQYEVRIVTTPPSGERGGQPADGPGDPGGTENGEPGLSSWARGVDASLAMRSPETDRAGNVLPSGWEQPGRMALSSGSVLSGVNLGTPWSGGAENGENLYLAARGVDGVFSSRFQRSQDDLLAAFLFDPVFEAVWE